MKLSIEPATRILRRTVGRSYIAPLACVVTLVTSGCSQRYEWRDHYVDPPASPKPKPKPSPKPVDSSEPTNGSGETSASIVSSDDAGLDVTVVATGDAGRDAEAPLVEGAPLVNAELSDLALEVFGTNSNRYWFVVSSEQVDAMNEGRYGGPIGNYGDIYSPSGNNGDKTFVDHLLVTNAAGKTADVGKVQAKLVGGSTYRPWTASTLPNIKIDSDEFHPEVRVGGYEHLRFNNAVIGSIFREKFAFDFYRTLGYPAPHAGYAWVSSSVWSPDVAIPYVVVESYKRQFCRDRADYFGGECPNMWEFADDILWPDVFARPESCQYSDCDATLAMQMSARVAQTPPGPGFKHETSAFIDWDAFHEFQCLSWLFGTPDDYIHAGNNTLLVERPDGKFQFLPYSVDISFNHQWGWSTPLIGHTALPYGCQSDPDCWADTIATCEVLTNAYVAADPVGRLDNLYAELEAAGMLRRGDDARYNEMRSGIQTRLDGLADELAYWRDNPDGNYGECPYPHVQCGDYCALPEECYLCGHEPKPEPPRPLPVPGVPLQLLAGDGGTADGGTADGGMADGGTADAAPDGRTEAGAGSSGGLTFGEVTSARGGADLDSGAPALDTGATEVAVTSDGTDDTTGGQTCQPYINHYSVY